MRTPLIALPLFMAVACSLVIAAPATTGASVPDKPFTQTLCEGDSDSVARLYTAGLGRDPEQGGFDFWITEYTLGTWTFPRMAEFFVNSPEFQESYGELDQDQFIRQLYRNVLGREGEAGGVTFWNEQMDLGMTRPTVLMRFAESPENIELSGTVAPTLGEFNEGRPEGPWRCGPSLANSLLQASDFASNTTQTSYPTTVETDATDCDAQFALPVTSEGVSFSLGAGVFPQTFQVSYIAPTTHGAQRIVEQVRAGFAACGSYIDPGGNRVTASELAVTSHGDDFVAIDFAIDSFIWVARSHYVLIQDGPVVVVMQNLTVFDDMVAHTARTESYAELLADRIAALPIDS